MSDQTPPCYSRPWLGRPFVLTEESMAWGRYVVPSNGVPPEGLRHVAPDKLAQIFGEQLEFHRPEDMQYFENEVQALQPHYAEPGPRTFDAVLRAVFEAAKSIHAMHSAYYVEYAGPERGLYGGLVRDETTTATYLAWFSEHFVLQSIEACEGKRVVWSWAGAG